MTDQTEIQTQDELEVLKARADKMGISYHPSIGVEKLRAKINETLESDEAPVEETESQRRLRLRREAAALVRVRVTCMNPSKREWDGEIFTASNAVVGTFKRYVPFNAEDGWHVERMILNQMKQRKCQVFHTVKDSRGNRTRQGKLIPEFAIEELPPLTEKELKELAQRQAMAAGQ